MARVFTIYFELFKTKYTALVSFRDQGLDMSFIVRYLNADVKDMLPDGKLVISLSQGIINKGSRDKVTDELIYHTSEAISKYLQLDVA